MLKTDVIILYALILQMEWNWEKVVAYILAILSGIVLGTSIEIKQGTLTKRSFLLRLMQVFGLAIISYYVWKEFYIKKVDFVFALFAIGLFSDTIITVGYKIGKMGIVGYFKYLAGQIPQDKTQENND